MIPIPQRDPDFRIVVQGLPAPGGSKSAFAIKRQGRYITAANGRPVISLVDDGKGNKAWRAAVRAHGALAMRAAGIPDPIDAVFVVVTEFMMPRPKGHLNSRGEIKPSAPRYPSSRPDVLKLMRSTEDALTKVVWADDSQVVRQSMGKVYAEPGASPGAVIRIWTLTQEELA